MGSLTCLQAADVREAVLRYRDVLRSHQEELNRLNVYPVPDGDTGTNMALTLESVCTKLDGDAPMAEVCEAISHGSLMGARGNSGVILSQVLRGIADSFSGLAHATATDVAGALRRASDAAYQAVMRPVEGTILTVVRAAAEGAERHLGEHPDSTLTDLIDAAARSASDTLARTPEMLPALKQAGVVDAGGRGFALFLDALLNVVDGRPLPDPVEVTPLVPVGVGHGRELPADDISALRYEVMFFLEADDGAVPPFKAAWAEIGDSIVVVGGAGTWNCHIHTDDVGAAIEAAVDAGRPRSIRVTDLQGQVEEEQWVREHQTAVPAVAVRTEPATTAVVVVAAGAGVRKLFESLGVHAVVGGGQSMNPSTEQLLAAVEAAPADAAVILPNNKNIIPVARQVGAVTSKRVEVVPTTAIVEGLSALVAYDPDAELRTNVGAMNEAAARVKSGEVTRAVRDSAWDGGAIAAGDWMAIARDGIVAVKRSGADALLALAEHLIDDDSELVTVVVGADAHPADTARLQQHLLDAHPELDAEFHDGGQPLYPWLVGVE
jgi:hypothetical protein